MIANRGQGITVKYSLLSVKNISVVCFKTKAYFLKIRKENFAMRIWITLNTIIIIVLLLYIYLRTQIEL